MTYFYHAKSCIYGIAACRYTENRTSSYISIPISPMIILTKPYSGSLMRFSCFFSLPSSSCNHACPVPPTDLSPSSSPPSPSLSHSSFPPFAYRDYVHYIDVIFCKAALIINSLLKEGNGSYSSFHIRRYSYHLDIIDVCTWCWNKANVKYTARHE